MDLFDLVIAKKLAGGGGGSSYTLIESKEYEVYSSSSTEKVVGEFTVDNSTWADKGMLLVCVYDKAGQRNNYFWCSFALALYPTQNNMYSNIIIRKDYSGYFSGSTSKYGVYVKSLSVSDGTTKIELGAKYSNTYSLNIDGTYKVDVYCLDFPSEEFIPV